MKAKNPIRPEYVVGPDSLVASIVGPSDGVVTCSMGTITNDRLRFEQPTVVKEPPPTTEQLAASAKARLRVSIEAEAVWANKQLSKEIQKALARADFRYQQQSIDLRIQRSSMSNKEFLNSLKGLAMSAAYGSPPSSQAEGRVLRQQLPDKEACQVFDANHYFFDSVRNSRKYHVQGGSSIHDSGLDPQTLHGAQGQTFDKVIVDNTVAHPMVRDWFQKKEERSS